MCLAGVDETGVAAGEPWMSFARHEGAPETRFTAFAILPRRRIHRGANDQFGERALLSRSTLSRHLTRTCSPASDSQRAAESSTLPVGVAFAGRVVRVSVGDDGTFFFPNGMLTCGVTGRSGRT